MSIFDEYSSSYITDSSGVHCGPLSYTLTTDPVFSGISLNDSDKIISINADNSEDAN